MTKPTTKLPAISIIIPTYGRSDFLKNAIFSALRQKNVSLEVLVVDDFSPDNTKKVVEEIKDKRIRYVRNTKRLGTGENFLKCFRLSKGDYIFTLGDDDLILHEYALRDILNLMKKHKVGVGRIGNITYDDSIQKPYDATYLSDKILAYKPKKGFNIIAKSVEFGLGYFSGVIFDTKRFDKKMLKVNHKCFPDHMCNAYLRIGYDLVKRFGIIYIPHNFIVTHLSLSLIPKYFRINKYGKTFLEDTLDLMSEFTSNEELVELKKTYLRSQLILLPNIKYFTNIDNYLEILKRIVTIDNTLIFNPIFLLYTISGFLPNFVMKAIRVYIVSRSRNKISSLLEKYKYHENIKLLGF